MKHKLLFTAILLTCLVYQSVAQHVFRAQIRDSITHETLIGATALETGTNNGAVADLNGYLKLTVNKSGTFRFTIRYTGYTTKIMEVKIPQQDSVLQIFLLPETVEMEEVVISSMRTNTRIEDIPTRIETLGLDDLTEENGIKPGNILSLLGDIAGVQMQQISASSGNMYARIQGLDGRYTQLLKDGMPLFGGLSGSFGILQIPPLDLQQIEIIKGSCATLYGGDAIGGIINLISKLPHRHQELGVTLNQTTLRETNFNVYASKRNEKFGYTFFAGQTLQKQVDVDDDGLSDVPNVTSTVIHPKLVFYLNPKAMLTVNYTGTFDIRKGGDMNYFKDASPDTLYHINTLSQRHSADVKFVNEFSKTSNLSIKLSSSYLNQEYQTKRYDFKASQLIYYSEISYFCQKKKMNWITGLNINGDKFTRKENSAPSLRDYNNQTLGAFIQNTCNLTSKFTIESGFRLDYHSVYDLFPLPRLSMMYKVNKMISARVSGGLGYKIPNEITYIDPETDLQLLLPADKLKPEHSQGLNADVNFQKLVNKELLITFNQSLFITNITSPIYKSYNLSGEIVLQNASQAFLTRGLQSYVRLNYRFLELYLGYVFTDVEKKYDASFPVPVATPKHNISGTLMIELNDKLRFGIESAYVADQRDQNYRKTRNYLICAAMIQYRYGNISFVLNGENLLDIRQSRYDKVWDGNITNPSFRQLWAPIDGRVINLSVSWKL